MNFSFNTATTTPSTFGGTAAPAAENKPTLNFGSPSGSTFAFGGAAKTTAAAPSPFSSPAATNAGSAFGASKPLAFGGFTSPPNQTVGSPGFGQPAAQNAAQNLSFGSPQPAPAFGTPATQAAAPTAGFGASPSGGGFSFGKPAATTGQAAGGFGFATPTSGFSAPQPATATTSTAPVTTQSGFLGSTPAPSFGAASSFGAKPGSAFSFGPMQTPGFGMASTPASTTSTGLALPGQQPQQQQQQQPQQPTATQSGLSFGTTTTGGLSFGQPTATPALSSGFGQTAPGLSFGSPASTAAAPTGLGSFGTTTTAAQPTPAPTLPGFGAIPSSTPQPTAGLSLGTTVATTPNLGFATSLAPTSVNQTSTGLSFGTTTTSQPNFGTTATSQPNFGTTATTGLSFGTATTTQPTAGLSFGTTAATTGLSFGTTTSAPASGLSFGTTTTAATTSSGFGFSGTSTANTGLGFGIKPTTTAATSAAATTAPSGITALGKTTTAIASLTTTTTTTTVTAPPQMVTSITFAQLEENINKWTLELEEQEKTFINQATQINAWDRLLIANGEKIVELNDAVQTVKNEQQSLEHELDFVLAQQKELEDMLSPMEKQLLAENTDRLRDPEREHMYSLAENLDTQLRQMSEDLKEVIEHLNETNRSQDSNDPIVQIGRILNAHMSSMQWIDNSIAQISTRLDQLKATHDTLRRDNERSFQLTYN